MIYLEPLQIKVTKRVRPLINHQWVIVTATLGVIMFCTRVGVDVAIRWWRGV